jgi:hypothetical protein
MAIATATAAGYVTGGTTADATAVIYATTTTDVAAAAAAAATIVLQLQLFHSSTYTSVILW